MEDSQGIIETKTERKRYASTKGDADKRRITALENLAKARAKKLQLLEAGKSQISGGKKSKKGVDEYIIYSDSDDSNDSDGEEHVAVPQKPKAKSRKLPRSQSGSGNEIEELRKMIGHLAKEIKRPKEPKTHKTIVNVVNPEKPKAPTNSGSSLIF